MVSSGISNTKLYAEIETWKYAELTSSSGTQLVIHFMEK